MKQISLRKALELFGATEITIHNGYNYRYGFYVKDEQLYYFNTGDLRYKYSLFLNRTAKDRKDWIGGCNEYAIDQFIKNKGYVIHYPKLKCDRNN